MGFALESQELKELSFDIVSTKTKLHFQKKYEKQLIFGPFLHKFEQK